jgi:tRNA splicing endonuclease
MELIVPKDEKLIELGFGIEKEGKLVLHNFEAAYAIENGYMKPLRKKLLSGKGDFAKYLVYKDLRDNGYISRLSLSGDFFRVYRKGFRRGEDRTMYLLKVITEKSLKISDIFKDAISAAKIRKELVYAVVEGKRITYVSISGKRFP